MVWFFTQVYWIEKYTMTEMFNEENAIFNSKIKDMFVHIG